MKNEKDEGRGQGGKQKISTKNTKGTKNSQRIESREHQAKQNEAHETGMNNVNQKTGKAKNGDWLRRISEVPVPAFRAGAPTPSFRTE